MALTKTLKELITRADENAWTSDKQFGTAVQRKMEVQEITTATYSAGPMTITRKKQVEVWRVEYEPSIENIPDELRVFHYGKLIADIALSKTPEPNTLQGWHGESASDRNALNGLVEEYNLRTLAGKKIEKFHTAGEQFFMKTASK